MRKLHIRRTVAAILAVIMALSLSVSAFAVETEAEDGTGTEPPQAMEQIDGETDTGLATDVPGSSADQGPNPGPEEAVEEVPAEPEPEETATTAPEQPPEGELPTISFMDVPEDHTFIEGIMDCAAKGITSGYADGTFKPANTVTRAQFCVMLSRAFYPAEVKKYDTDDNKAKGWFVPNTQALYSAGVLANTSFQYAYDMPSTMDQIISRYDMAALMTNIMAKKGFSATAAQKTEAQKKIGDYANLPSKYREAVKNVFALGIITGYSDGTFGGAKNMNRGQGCVVIYRMMHYTPATSTKPNTGDTTYDDGKTETKPETKPSTGNTGSSTGTTTGNTSSNTSNTGNSNQNGVLTNGKAITEDNVLAMIKELLKKYPNGMKWDDNTYRESIVSRTMNQIATSYTRANAGGNTTNMQRGCGGFASLISDSIFGQGTLNPARKVPVEYVRPGDVIIKLNAEGKLMHVAIAASRITGVDEYGDGNSPILTIYDGNANSKVRYNNYYAVPKTYSAYRGYYVEIWTRYPSDNTTPWASSNNNTNGSTSGNTSNNTGSSSTNTTTPSSPTINYVTTSNPCGICGKVGGRQVRSNDGGRYACESCYNDPSGLGKWFVE